MKQKMAVYNKLYIAGGILLALLVILSLPFALPRVLGYSVLRVETDSMEPTYPVGSVIYVAPVNDYTELQVGDVISFRTDSGSSMLTTHRIVEIKMDGSYITKGDNNQENDLDPVIFERISGKVVMGISALGFVAPVFDNLYGRILLFVLAAFAVGLWVLGDYTKRQQKKLGLIQKKEKKPSFKGPFKHDYVTLGLVLIGVGLIMYGGSKIISINVENNKSKELYHSLEAQFVTTDIPTISTESQGQEENTGTEGTEESPTNKEWYELVRVDMDKLKKYNSDAVAWLYFEDGSISYPVLYSGDNTTYYRHNISKSYDDNGAIFVEALNKPNLTDANTFVYGHNMRSFAMFGKLRYYRLDSSYYEKHQYYQMITGDKIYRYHIFAYENVKDNSDLFTVYREGNEDFEQFLSDVRAASMIKTDITVTKDDKVITMVTCNGEADERFLVHAVLEEVYDRNEESN